MGGRWRKDVRDVFTDIHARGVNVRHVFMTCLNLTRADTHEMRRHGHIPIREARSNSKELSTSKGRSVCFQHAQVHKSDSFSQQTLREARSKRKIKHPPAAGSNNPTTRSKRTLGRRRREKERRWRGKTKRKNPTQICR